MRRHLRKLRKSKLFRDIILFGIGFGFILMGIFFVWASTLKVPDLESFSERRVTQSAKIYDRTGQVLLYDLGQDTKRTIIPGDAISPDIKNATVAIEDSSFYQHHGIRITAIFRAILADLIPGGYTQGGSTITQQVVKNSLLTTDKTLSRKLKEWVLSLKLERVLTKDEILAIYLNESPYGGSLYGVQESSQAFFGKNASDVDLAQAAYLAALPQAPTFYSPYGNHRAALDARKNLVLQRMLDIKFITKEQYDQAKAEQVTFLPQGDQSIKAPHFVFFVREYLENKYGKEAVESQGLKVTTTLDFNLQDTAEKIVNKYALENVTKFKATNAGLVAIDPKTGEILSMVGSRNYFDPQIDGNFNITLASRQPGSSFKPIVYATAFEKGYTPDTVLFDLKTQFSTSCNPDDFSKISPCFSPDNYDGKFRGPVSLRSALAQSLNVPSVKVLYLAGIDDSLSTARDLGITTLEGADRYGLTLVLGGGEVTLLEMTSAYSVFANDGVRNSYVSVLKVEDSSGKVLEEYTPTPTKVLEPNIARTISDILSDNQARIPAYGENSPLYFANHQVAVKTGTTNDSKDAWIIGYTPSIAIGTWAGNNDNSPMVKQVAGLIVAPMWHAVMAEALKSLPNEPIPRPDPIDPTTVRPILRGVWQGGQVYIIDKFSGNLATDSTPPEAREEKAVTNVHSILFWIDKNNPAGAPPSNPANDPQFKYWEYPVQLWASQNGMTAQNGSVIPTGSDTIHTSNSLTLSVSGINAGANYLDSSQLTLAVSGSGAYPLTRVDFYINNTLVGSSNASPFSFNFSPKDVSSVTAQNTLTIVGYDSVFNKSTVSIPFQVTSTQN